VVGVTRVLLVGATGIVGTELRRRLSEARGVHLDCVSRRGSNDGVVAWGLGTEGVPSVLSGRWDVVVNAAANTRWTQNPESAVGANVETVRALCESALSPSTWLVHVSTSFAGGKQRSTASPSLESYNNTYEWSKAAAERFIAEIVPRARVVRIPLVVGRRRDGSIRRYNGIYSFIRALATGLAPAVIGEPTAYLDAVAVDDAAAHIAAAALEPEGWQPLTNLGSGAMAPSVEAVLDGIYRELNDVRLANGVEPLERVPILSPERWDRFLFPFAADVFSRTQLAVIERLSEFRPYLCVSDPLPADTHIEPLDRYLGVLVRRWAQDNRRAALGTPKRWRARDLETADDPG
jgi:nucleoside-diphosphate-sugar epimerase